jgi:hypothetical protein
MIFLAKCNVSLCICQYSVPEIGFTYYFAYSAYLFNIFLHILLQSLHIILPILYTKKRVYFACYLHIILHITVHILHIYFHVLHVICCIVFPAWAASGQLNTMDMSLSQQAKVFKHTPACAPP